MTGEGVIYIGYNWRFKMKNIIRLEKRADSYEGPAIRRKLPATRNVKTASIPVGWYSEKKADKSPFSIDKEMEMPLRE